MKKVVIIDYGLGNLTSVANAVTFLGHEPLISHNRKDIETADCLILPGVGAFQEGMDNLRERGLIDVLGEVVIKKKKPILGICLGFELFAKESEEHGIFEGLGWVDGKIEKLDANGLRLPHIGWNNVKLVGKERGIFSDIKDDNFYFVHSYGFKKIDEDVVTAECSYGKNFIAALRKDNIFGTQFHPEKSHVSGLKVLRNFIECSDTEAS